MTIVTKKAAVFLGALGFLALGTGLFMYQSASSSKLAYIDPSDQTLLVRGRQIYTNNCAACHGARLEGQNDWRTRKPNGRLPAPPHDKTGHTWHHPDALLIDIVKNGLVPGKTAPPGYVSDMPAYGQSLSDPDIAAVLAYIKSSWPPKALAAQKEITLQPRQ